jgi:predicted AAA+ superfamily ATPase
VFRRLIHPSQSNSFFLFGPRGTGKSTLLHKLFKAGEAHFIDLLDPALEDLYHRNPHELERRIAALPEKIQWIVLDEIQKAPRLLDVVHHLIESTHRRFVLTGSSARKLKRGASNLLAGRAFVYALYPMTFLELGNSFDLTNALQWGTLPKIFHLRPREDKIAYLRAYALTYLKEEIIAEQIVRRLDPFRHFLEVAAQCNGQILNYAKISRDIGVDIKTTQSFFSILDETLVGLLLPAYHRSLRKRQRTQPKFYFFDLGVKRALERTLEQELHPRTWAFGQAFEHFIVLEAVRLASYFEPDWRFSYLRTKDDAEIDLIVDRPGRPTAMIEIKSTTEVKGEDTAALRRFQKDMPNSEAYCFSLDPHPKVIDGMWCVPWQEGFKRLGLAKPFPR